MFCLHARKRCRLTNGPLQVAGCSHGELSQRAKESSAGNSMCRQSAAAGHFAIVDTNSLLGHVELFAANATTCKVNPPELAGKHVAEDTRQLRRQRRVRPVQRIRQEFLESE